MKTASLQNTFGFYADRYGPQSAIVGVAAAVTAHLLAEKNRRTEEKKMFGRGDDDPGLIRIKLPPKTAEANPALAGLVDSVNGFREKMAEVHPTEDKMWRVPAMIGAVGGIGYGSYRLADYILKGLEQRKIKKELSTAKDNYMDLVYRDLDTSKPKVASQLPVVDGLMEAVVDRLEEVAPYEKTALLGLFPDDNVAFGTSALVASGILAAIHSFRQSRKSESDVDEYLRQKSRKTPIDTRIVVEEADNPKVAQLNLTPPTVTKKTTAAEDIAKAQAAAGVTASPEQKAANLYALGVTGTSVAKLNQDQGNREEDKAEEQVQRARAEDQRVQQLSTDSPITTVDDNTVIINTSLGPVTIDAMDKRSMRFLKRRPNLVRDIVNVPQTAI